MTKEIFALKRTNTNWIGSYYLENNTIDKYVKVALRDISSPVAKKCFKVIVTGNDDYGYSVIYKTPGEAQATFSTLALKEFVDLDDLAKMGFGYD